MKLLLEWIWIFAFGSLAFLLEADFEVERTDMWANLYYIWDIGKDLFIFIVILKLRREDFEKIRAKEYRLTIYSTIIYLSIRSLWALIKPLTTLDENHPLMVSVMFTAALIILITLLLVDLKKRKKELIRHRN